MCSLHVIPYFLEQPLLNLDAGVGARSCLNLMFQALLTPHGSTYGEVDGRWMGGEWERGGRGEGGKIVIIFCKMNKK